MHDFFKKFLYILSMVYMAQFFISLFFDINDVDRWSRWTEVEFHLGICSGCLFVPLFGHTIESIIKMTASKSLA